jgi:hypothetical protein
MGCLLSHTSLIVVTVLNNYASILPMKNCSNILTRYILNSSSM